MSNKAKSMTGFGNAEIPAGAFLIRTNIKTLNGKFFDLDLRMPRQLTLLEAPVRMLIQEHIERGSCTAQVSIERNSGDSANAQLPINQALATTYRNALQSLAADLQLPEGSLFQTILTMPDVIGEKNLVNDENIGSVVLASVEAALTELNNFRSNEGNKIGTILANCIHIISAGLEKVEAEEPLRKENLRKRLWDMLENYMGDGRVDRNRFEQELLMYTEKLDIAEEKNRLRQHISYFLETLEHNPAGRKLNFIAQEMGREINTLGVKSNHFPMQKAVVEMKEQLEQIKEQVLNLL